MSDPDHWPVVDGLEHARRVAWAKYYDELHENQRLSAKAYNDANRITELVEVLRRLVDALLAERYATAYFEACRIDAIIRLYEDREQAG